MGKAAMCIQLLEILNTGRIYKISDLASLLETNPRNIVEYKKELEECGYSILSIPGRYGGYQLEKSGIIPALKLVEDEKEALIDSFNFSMAKKDFLKKENLIKAMGKINSRLEIEEKDQSLLVVDHYQLQMSEEEIHERYQMIEKAIEEKKVIEIEYESLRNGLKTHQLHPYQLFIYNNSWFFLALNIEAGEVWYFKLNRVRKITLFPKHFTVWKNFKAEDYFDGNGFKNNGEFFHMIFLVKGLHRNLIKERVYGKNQIVTNEDDETIRVELDMQNEDQIISFVLSWGLDIKVLSPVEIAEKIKAKAKQISEMYEIKLKEN